MSTSNKLYEEMHDICICSTNRDRISIMTKVLADSTNLGNAFTVGSMQLLRIILAYVLLPVVLFCALWLKPVIGVVLCTLLIVAYILQARFGFIKKKLSFLRKFDEKAGALIPGLLGGFNSERECAYSISCGSVLVVLLAVIAITWSFLGGQGSFWYQSPDWDCRNAIFNALITYDWPVYFNEGTEALCYYLNHWLVPAGIAKVLFLGTGNAALAVAFGNVLLLIWTSLGIFLVELSVLLILKVTNRKAAAIAIVLLVFFSGTDIIGSFFACVKHGNFSDLLNTVYPLHLEWWAKNPFQFSSNTTLLFWVFNQTVIPWLCTCAVLLSRRVSDLGLILVACLGAGPFAAVGLFFICLFLFLYAVVVNKKSTRASSALISLFSPMNICACLVAVVYFSFYLINQSINVTAGHSDSYLLNPLLSRNTIAYGAFIILESGLCFVLLFFKQRKNPLYWCVVIFLLLAPLIHIGSTYEFCLRATIPALFCLMLLCSHTLIDAVDNRVNLGVRDKVIAILLTICLCIGAITPLVEFARGFVSVAKNGIEASIAQPFDLEGSQLKEGETHNFKAPVDEDSFYFKYLSRGINEE